MTKDYPQLWKDVTSASDEGKAVRTLAEILVKREGRASTSNLGRGDAELCIEILEHVSLSLIHDPIRFPLSPTHGFFIRASQCTTSNGQRNRLSSSL